ncbi:MAG: GH92 family glycosyl hydrolase [Tannerella sp.]|jgi:predicted alpha-1,2-mannosidase|nr:GH92 family glycosyl hydrolase [Tannerella sp.]
MKIIKLSYIIFAFVLCACNGEQKGNSLFVNKFIGTGVTGKISPLASVPAGMIQLGADTQLEGSGYNYSGTEIIGFSHIHKSGGGCNDFLDISFMPLPANTNVNDMQEFVTGQFRTAFSHNDEKASPGYYSVLLYDEGLKVELTASSRCGIQRYQYKQKEIIPVAIDLNYGSTCACTIESEHNIDTVYAAAFEVVDKYTVRGYRITNGWAPEQHVYFYTRFSTPIRDCILYIDNIRQEGITAAESRNLKAVLTFEADNGALDIKTGVSAVDLDGAMRNYVEEADGKTFIDIEKEASLQWASVLNQIEIETPDTKKKEIFYTALHNVMVYPMLYSDVDGRFRGPDRQIHRSDGFRYFGGVIGLWDTYRAACPLIAVLHPDVTEDYIKTALEFYKYAGQLPIWTLAGAETCQMTGIHSLPMITNGLLNGITGFDKELALKAMVASATKDTCGYSMGYFVGLKNYKQYGYVPCDLEMEATARTLEYAFDDYALSQFARLTGNTEVQNQFAQRSQNYRNVIDTKSLFARGRKADGSWKTPFDPLSSEHRRDEYCEGNAWQWTFSVQHDVEGLAKLMGGKEVLAGRLDSLFTMSSELHGSNASGDISGLIGQYAHGNEPSHHIIYMYNAAGQPQKTQYYVNQVLTTLYDNTPQGICGDEDTGQMSAWYVFSALGFYPMDPVSGRYEIGAPLFDRATIHLPSGKQFVIKASNLSDTNIYVDKMYLNGKPLDRTYLTFDELLQGGELHFEMTDKTKI